MANANVLFTILAYAESVGTDTIGGYCPWVIVESGSSDGVELAS